MYDKCYICGFQLGTGDVGGLCSKCRRERDAQTPVFYSGEKYKELEEQNASLLAELKEYDNLAAEYGITGKQMLMLAKSQIATAKANCEMLDELQRYREAEKEGRLFIFPHTPERYYVHHDANTGEPEVNFELHGYKQCCEHLAKFLGTTVQNACAIWE